MQAGEALCENIAKSKTREQLNRNLANEARWFNYSQELADDLWDLVEKIWNLPTGYFEAKPRRAVGLNEIKAVVLPEDIDIKIKKLLDDNGISYTEYDGTSEDRLEKVNEAATQTGIRFSRNAEDGRIYSRKEYEHHGWAVDADILTERAFAVYNEKIGKLKQDRRGGNENTEFVKSHDGLYIIPTSNYELEGKGTTDDILIYTNGNYDAPSIERIVVIFADDTEEPVGNVLAKVHKEGYDAERNKSKPDWKSIASKHGNTIIYEYEKQSHNNYDEYLSGRGEGKSRGTETYTEKQDGGRGSEETSGTLRLSRQSDREAVSGVMDEMFAEATANETDVYEYIDNHTEEFKYTDSSNDEAAILGAR